MSSQVYEIIKTIYATTSDAEPNPISTDAADPGPRIKVLQSTLGQLRLNNIATLDALTTHFTRLIDLTSADEAYVTNLAQTLAPCILRPRAENSLTMDERHAYRLVRDLFEHKDVIFGELKRQSASLGHLGGPAPSFGGSQRARAVSTSDESNRRANMEARAKAITEQRTREKSPAPTNRHRREKSTDGSMSTRFPIAVAANSSTPTRTTMNGSTTNRQSLEVPGSLDSSPASDRAYTSSTTPMPSSQVDESPRMNGASSGMTDSMPGAFMGGGPGPHIPPAADDDSSPISPEQSHGNGHGPGYGGGYSGGYGSGNAEPRPEKQNSIKRSTMSGSGRGRKAVPSLYGAGALSSQSSLEGVREGVTLSDRPMDD